MSWFQIVLSIWFSLYFYILVMGILIQKKKVDIENSIVGRLILGSLKFLTYFILILPLTLLSSIGVYSTLIGLVIIYAAVILALSYIDSNCITYIMWLGFSIVLAYYAERSYNSIFKAYNIIINTGHVKELSTKLKNRLDKINFRIITYTLLLLIYFTKNCLIFTYEKLEYVPKDIFFGHYLPIENLFMTSSEALLTFVIIDTIIMNSPKLKNHFKLN